MKLPFYYLTVKTLIFNLVFMALTSVIAAAGQRPSFDEPAKMLVAIATDDTARMWVNDRLVWGDQELSGWSLNEGFRIIDFRKGFNNFLVRIENGPVLCEFSGLLCPPDQVKK